jgi:PAS domain S-box-containing protein
LAEAQRVAHLGSWEWRIGESRVDWSDEMYRVYGLAPASEPITYERYVSLIHPEDRQLAEETVRQAVESGAPFTMEHRIIRPDGSVRLISGRGKVVTDDAGEPVLMVGTGQDITEQRERALAAQRALSDEVARQESERARQHLESILASIGDGFITLDSELRFTYLNPEARRLLRLAGRDPEAVIGKHPFELFPAERMAPLLGAVERVRGTGKPVRYETLLQPLGRWAEVRVHAMRDGIALYIRDVHEEKVASERTAALQRLTQALSSALTPLEVSEIVLRQGMAALGATAGGVVLITPDGSEMEVVKVIGFDEDVVRPFARFPVERPYPVNDIVRQRRMVSMESLDDWRARYPVVAPVIETGGCEAYFGAPLEIEERVLGAIGYSFLERRTFSEEDEAFLRALAGQTAQALERSRLFEAERLARAQAEAANTAKMQFLTMMSHELRTPLNAIAGYSELLALGVHGPITEQQRDDLQRIQRSQKHLLGLINDILNFAKVESGHVHFDLAVVPVNAALHAVEQLVSPQLRAKGLEYRFEPPPEELLVHADREKMLQVVLNLLSNAMKFTPTGGRIRLDAEGRDGVVAIRVHDTGIGIPPDKLEMIFDPFVQVSGSYTRTFEGTGLGLAISRDLARAMGGDLVAESRVGEGSVFTFTLPRREGGGRTEEGGGERG